MARGLIDLLYSVVLLFSFLTMPVLILQRLIAKKPFLAYLKGAESGLDFGGRPVLWVQAVSVGEAAAVLPFLKAWRERYPEWAIYLTTTTISGQQTAERLALAYVDHIGYFPLDYSYIAKKAIDRVRPALFVAAESETWPNFLRILKTRKIPAAIINGRISDRSYRRYFRLRRLMRPVWDRIDVFCLQTERDAERFLSLGVPPERIVVTGNIKFDIDYPAVPGEILAALKRMVGWEQGQPILTAASTHPGEEEAIIRVLQRLRKSYDCRLILAPRHPHRREEVERLLEAAQLSWIRRSEPGTAPQNVEVLLMDTFGELALGYAAGDMVFIGGSWAAIGGHNILEAAAQRRAVAYGPHMHNFHEIETLFRQAGVGFIVEDEDALAALTMDCWNRPEHWRTLGERAYAEVMRYRGATSATIAALMDKEGTR